MALRLVRILLEQVRQVLQAAASPGPNSYYNPKRDPRRWPKVKRERPTPSASTGGYPDAGTPGPASPTLARVAQVERRAPSPALYAAARADAGKGAEEGEKEGRAAQEGDLRIFEDCQFASMQATPCRQHRRSKKTQHGPRAYRNAMRAYVFNS